MPKATREKRILVSEGLAWLLGKDSLGYVSAIRKRLLPSTADKIDCNEAIESTGPTHSLSFANDPANAISMRRRRCKRGEWASAAAEEVNEEGIPRVEGDQGGWRWEWCTS